MKIGVVTMALGKDFSFEAGLAKFREIGFDHLLLIGIEGARTVAADGTCPDVMPDILKSDPDHVLRTIANAGLELASVYFAGRSGWMDLESEQGARLTAETLKEYSAAALRLGCNCLSHPVQSCGRSKVPTEEKAGPIKRLAGCMSEAAATFAAQSSSQRSRRSKTAPPVRGWTRFCSSVCQGAAQTQPPAIGISPGAL